MTSRLSLADDGAMRDRIDREPEDARDEQDEADATADPALDNGENADWESEGGATPGGPATRVDDA